MAATMGLQGFERRLEKMVEGTFAKAFRSGLQPVELGRRLTREMDLNRQVGIRGVMVPNHFFIGLSPADSERFASFEGSLERELADAAREHAHSCDYRFVGAVTIEIEKVDSVKTGTFLIDGEVDESSVALTGTIVMPSGERIEVGEATLRIGRLPDCDITIADPNVSRGHAEIRRDGDHFVVADLDSMNGTKVNGAAVKVRDLSPGDAITIADTTMRFEQP